MRSEKGAHANKKDECYKQYLKDHSHPKCRLMHFVGQCTTIFYAIWVGNLLFTWPYSPMCWVLFSFTPLIVYPFAVGGHILFGEKGNRPSFTKMGLFRAKICDIKMFLDILRGKLSIW